MYEYNLKGRGAKFNPQSRFEKLYIDSLDPADITEEVPSSIPTTYFKDTSKTVIAKNDSEDLDFEYSFNPYRGCEHGCIYCYARPSHEYLGFSSGIDFETKIMVKEDAHLLLEKEFQSKSYKPDKIVFSGNTDCYQPLERKLGITRKALEVCLKYRNPVSLITKNALVTRDADIFSEMAKLNLISVTLSITSLDPVLSRKMEPRASLPERRVQALEKLASLGIPVGVNCAPIIPGLNDKEIPLILKTASEKGASSAGYILIRLPFAVKDLFINWLEKEFPDKATKIINRILDTRGGKLNDPRWEVRFKGEGIFADTISDLFKLYRKKYGLNKRDLPLNTSIFRKTIEPQLNLFE